ncbi:Gifsy-2 prophage protein [Pseudomonas chlororaphis]
MVLHQCEPSEAFEWLEWFEIDRAVGKSRNQGPHLIKPISA